MKNRFLFSKGLILLLCLQAMAVIGQDARITVGKVQNKTGVLTDELAALKVLQAGLGNESSVSNARILGPDEKGKFYLVGDVTVNGKVNGKGIQLANEGNSLQAFAGPGIEISCVGQNCSRCILRFTKWTPYCTCEDPNPTPSSTSDAVQCDMISKYIVTTW